MKESTSSFIATFVSSFIMAVMLVLYLHVFHIDDALKQLADLDRRLTELEEWQEELSPHIPAVIEEWESWEDEDGHSFEDESENE